MGATNGWFPGLTAPDSESSRFDDHQVAAEVFFGEEEERGVQASVHFVGRNLIREVGDDLMAPGSEDTSRGPGHVLINQEFGHQSKARISSSARRLEA